MERICCVIDIDGFHLPIDGSTNRYKFFARELAYVRLSKEYTLLPHSRRFDLRGKFAMDKLDAKSKLKVNHQIKLTGLSLFPLDDEPVMDDDDIPDLINEIYARCRTEDMNVIAYKGGIIEKNILKELKIKSVNLESYGCPRFEELIKSPISAIKNCGYHRETTVSVPHCPLAEVTVFRDWVQMQCRYRDSHNEDDDSESTSEESDSENED
ncbi:uncharacterized protein LOC129231453 [Uloborus diversus]|uniref:uncharacterized protein LOC129231453 n=1 Tax=Uloborus diversus TaxID=327109 RepID=UPI0024095B84|nr:uncharacterized protein LOC129231453 [Uloborus diversus]